MFARIFVEVIVKRTSPVARLFTFQQWKQRFTLYIIGDVHSGQLEEGGGIVDVLHQLIHFSLFTARQTHEQRCAERFFIHEPFVEPTMFAHIEPLVGGVDNQRIFKQVVLFQVFQYHTDVTVYRMDHAEVIMHVTLVFPLGKLLTGSFLFLEVFDDRIVVLIPRSLLVGVHPVVHGTSGSFQPFAFCADFILLVGHLQVVHLVHIFDDAHLLLGCSQASFILVVEIGR